MADNKEQMLRKALRVAFNLGQTYWQQADSDSYKQQDKSSETADKFVVHVNATVAALADEFSPQDTLKIADSDAARLPYCPDLTAIINWLEGGCDPQEAVKELRYHQGRITEAKKGGA